MKREFQNLLNIAINVVIFNLKSRLITLMRLIIFLIKGKIDN